VGGSAGVQGGRRHRRGYETLEGTERRGDCRRRGASGGDTWSHAVSGFTRSSSGKEHSDQFRYCAPSLSHPHLHSAPHFHSHTHSSSRSHSPSNSHSQSHCPPHSHSLPHSHSHSHPPPHSLSPHTPTPTPTLPHTLTLSRSSRPEPTPPPLHASLDPPLPSAPPSCPPPMHLPLGLGQQPPSTHLHPPPPGICHKRESALVGRGVGVWLHPQQAWGIVLVPPPAPAPEAQAAPGSGHPGQADRVARLELHTCSPLPLHCPLTLLALKACHPSCLLHHRLVLASPAVAGLTKSTPASPSPLRASTEQRGALSLNTGTQRHGSPRAHPAEGRPRGYLGCEPRGPH